MKIIEKINALDLAKNNQFKNAIIKFCIQSQDLQGKNKQETRDRIAFNAEQMITNRIIHLVKAELVSPAVSTVMGSTVSAIKDKLRQASEESKYRVRKEMQKHYQKVTLTVDNANTETGLAALATSPAGTKASSTLPLGVGSSATEPSTSSSKEDSPSKLPKGSGGTGGTGGQAPISALDLLLKPKQSKDAAAAAAVQKALDAWYEDPRVKCHLPYERYISRLGHHNNTATATTHTSSTADKLTTAQDVELPTTSRDTETQTTSSVQLKLSSIGNVEAAASGTAQAAEISLPVFEAMALRYGPKAARVFAKFGLKHGMRFIPGVGLAMTAHDVYDIAKPAINDMYNRWIAATPNEDSSKVAEKVTNEANYGPNECLLPLMPNRHEVEDPIERLLSIISNEQLETTEQSVKIWEVNDENTISYYQVETDENVDALTVVDYNASDKLEKRRHDDKGKSSKIDSKQQQASASTSFMPDPDDFEPDEKDKFKQHESGRYECAKAESPEWKKAQPFKSEFRSNGLSGKKKEYYRWDHYHKDIEVYDSDARYIGSKDPVTGKFYRKGNMKRNEKLKGITK